MKWLRARDSVSFILWTDQMNSTSSGIFLSGIIDVLDFRWTWTSPQGMNDSTDEEARLGGRISEARWHSETLLSFWKVNSTLGMDPAVQAAWRNFGFRWSGLGVCLSYELCRKAHKIIRSSLFILNPDSLLASGRSNLLYHQNRSRTHWVTNYSERPWQSSTTFRVVRKNNGDSRLMY